MTARFIVYAFLAIFMGGLVYLVGYPWVLPKLRKERREPSREFIDKAHRR